MSVFKNLIVKVIQVFFIVFYSWCNQGWAIGINSVYPSLGQLETSIDSNIFGSSFDSTSRLSMYIDSGNKGSIISSISTPSPSPSSVVVSENLAFVTDFGSGLQVVDVSNPLQPITIGSVSIPQANNVVVVGNKAYVTSNSGLHIIDVSSPTNPTIIDSLNTPGNAMSASIVKSFAYIADSSGGLQVIDINPDSPRYLAIIGSVDTSCVAFKISIVGDMAYIAGGCLEIINISDPTHPIIIDSANSQNAADVSVVGNIAYVTDFFGLKIFDVSNPSQPVVIGSVDTPGEARALTVIDNIVYITQANAWSVAGSTGLQVVDVNDPTQPVIINSVLTAPSESANHVTVVNNIAYLVVDSGKVHLIDVSNLSSLSIPLVKTSGIANNITVVRNTAYVTTSYGLEVVDVSTPTKPIIIGSVATPGEAQDVTVIGNLAYVADGYSGLQIINVSDPAHPSLMGSYDTPGRALGVVVVDNLAYVADGSSGLQIINVGDPNRLSLIGFRDTPGNAQDIAVSDNKAYLADESGGLQVINIQPGKGFLDILGSKYTDQYAESVTVKGNIALVGTTRGVSSLYVINVKDPTNLSITSSLSVSNSSYSISIVDETAYVAGGSDGLYVIDFSNPSEPVIIGSMDTHVASSVAVIGNKAFVASSEQGLVIVPAPVKLTSWSINSNNEITATLPSPWLPGNYTLRVYNSTAKDELFGAVTFTDEINLLSSKAIIVAGGGDYVGNMIWEETKAYANYAYDNLIYQGYKHEDITYITDETNPLYRYGNLASYANVKTSTKWNLKNTILNWAAQPDTSDLLIYMEDHGDTEEFVMRGGPTPEKVTANELDSWLDTLQATLSGKIILIYDACRSGSFISRITPPIGKIRLTLTSSTPDQTAYFLSNDHSFSTHFWSTFSGKTGNKAIMTEAFARATASMASYQASQLDVNGNGVPNEAEDYTALESHEGTIYALRRQYNFKNRSSPVISVVSGDQTAAGATLMAKSIYDVDGDAISRVWAEIYAPDFNEDQTDLTVTGNQLLSVSFGGPDGNGEYHPTVPPQFPVHGTYLLTYYAEDSSGIYSLPKTSLVSQSAGTTSIPPDLYEEDNTMADAQPIIQNSPTPQNHSFHINGDQDWVKFYGIAGQVYNIRAMNPTIISDPTITIYNNSRSVQKSSNNAGSGQEEAIIGWACPANGIYYVQLTNNTTHYGANVRYKLQIYNPIVLSLPGYITGKITSGGVGVAGAIVRADGGAAITLSDGSYIIYLKPGSYSISVSCDGYQPSSFSISVSSGGHTNIPNFDVNSIPRIVNSPLKLIKANEIFSFIPIVFEPDGDSYTFSVTGKPSWASFRSSNGQLWGKPSSADEGKFGPISVKVTDSAGASSSVVFTIEVVLNPRSGFPGIFILLLK